MRDDRLGELAGEGVLAEAADDDGDAAGLWPWDSFQYELRGGKHDPPSRDVPQMNEAFALEAATTAGRRLDGAAPFWLSLSLDEPVPVRATPRYVDETESLVPGPPS